MRQPVRFGSNKIVPIIFPKKTFKLGKICSNICLPLWAFNMSITKRNQLKMTLILLENLFCNLMRNWKKFKPLRSIIEDVFKIIKYTFSLKRIHKYTASSVQKTLYLGVIVASKAIKVAFAKNISLKQLAEM